MYKIPIYSKTPCYTGFPETYQKAKGAYIWSGGKKYLDMANFLGTHLLGYSNDYINRHIKKCIDKGDSCLLNNKYMKKLANLMLAIHPHFDMVRFGNSGGEAMYLALELTKEKIENALIHSVGYNGWAIKNNDWLVKYNCINDITKKTRPDILIFELLRHEYPKPETINLLKEWQKQGTILVIDEITSGFKLNFGGVHQMYDLEPDICVYSKCIGNGYPISIIVGKEKYMESDLFLSSTNWSNGIGFVAGYYTLKMLKHHDYRLLAKLGSSIMKVWEVCAKKHGIEIELGEVPQIADFKFKKKHLECKSIFVQEMMKQGIFASDQYYPMFAHTADHIGEYTKACNVAFGVIKKYLDNDKKIVYNKLEEISK